MVKMNVNNYDMGADGVIGGVNSNVAWDAYGFALHYYQDDAQLHYDYKAIGTGKKPFANPGLIGSTVYTELYNGNIGAISMNIPKVGIPLLSIYKYDQLNRLKNSFNYTGLNPGSNSWARSATQDYREVITYDPNGNIKTYKRNGSIAGGGQQLMDNMTYEYIANSNKLKRVTDNVPAAYYTEDIDNQTNANNYVYDEIGNLKSDASESITDITWTVYGKIASITKSAGTITYTYDAAGNRISKTANGKTTWYVRDASGNVMSVYVVDAAINSGDLTQSEIHLYGSSRLGILNLQKNVENPVSTNGITIFERGNKFFELTNHLGNVLLTVSDRKLQHSTDGTTVDYYMADVITASDYYPFGMIMPGRSYSNGNGYRYGFNGKELDKEVVQYDYGFRIYDPRLVRFKSVDPLTHSFSALSPYQYASNNPVEGVDLDGLEYVSSKEVRIEAVNGIVKLKVENMTTVVKNALKAYNENPDNWRTDPNTGFKEQGVDFSVAYFNIGKAMPQFPSFDPEPSDANPNNRPDRMATNTTTSTGQEFSTRREVTTASPGGAKGFAYLQVAMMALEYGVNGYIKYKSAIDADYINRHISAFKSAAADVQYALNKKEIPVEFQTQQYLSDITNVVLSGDSYVGKFDEAIGAKLKEIGLKIYNTYSVKRKVTLKPVTQTLGDGVTVNRIEVVPGPKYDAKYVAENPPLGDTPKPNP